MSKKGSSVSAPTPTQTAVNLGDNPVNHFHAREYARESSPSIVAVILELTENARDNATNVTLTIDVAEIAPDRGRRILKPKRIICADNGTGLSHLEFLNRFCGAFAESDAHHDTERAGRNGVGTKTYTSISESIIVETTTARPTEGLDNDREHLLPALPPGVTLPSDGEPDTLWRMYEFRLHTRSALAHRWSPANELEMGTRVELTDLSAGIEIDLDVLVERLSYAREWLQMPAHTFTLQLTGNTAGVPNKRIVLKPWNLPVKNWLVQVSGRSTEAVTIYDPTSEEKEVVQPPANLPGEVEFDFRVVGKENGQMQTLEKPALLLEICGALPYTPNLEGVQSARTSPLLTFLGLEHASSIGAFYNSVCGWARINSLPLKEALRNNKTTLASGPNTESVDALRAYLAQIFKHLHRAWYNATRASQDQAAADALKEATDEVNLALKGPNRNPFKGGDITRGDGDGTQSPTQPPTRRHRWECGSCGKRWLANAGFKPAMCAESDATSGRRDGCGSNSLGMAKNQPRIGDCEIRVQQLGDRKLPAVFQFEKASEDLDVPVVYVNLVSPRYVELRGTGSMSGQAQKRLKQYLVDAGLVAIAEYNSKVKGTDFTEELGDLQFNRMLTMEGGINQYEVMVTKLLDSTEPEESATAVAV